jgi:hypothetical protein
MSTSGYTRPKITPERLGSKPYTIIEVKKKQEKTNTTTKEKKTKLLTCSPTTLQNYQHPSTKPPQVKQVQWLPKWRPQEGNGMATAVVAPPKNRRKVFTWKTKTKQEASQQNASKEDYDTRRRCHCWHWHHNWESFRKTLCPMPTRRRRKRWTATPAATIKSARGEHLGSPQPNRRPTAREGASEARR